MEDIIRVEDLSKVYRIDTNRVIALDHVNMSIPEGEFCCIVGTSGSGKSTLLNMLAGLERPTRGSVIINGRPIETLSENGLVKFRQRGIGFIFQSFNLIPTMTALENVGLPLSFKGISKRKRDRLSIRALDTVGLRSHYKHKPSQMSGGQQQRVAIARALVVNPKIIFADEPTGNLDSRTSHDILQLLSDLAHEQHRTVVMVTHDQDHARRADRIIHILDGQITQIEYPQQEPAPDADILPQTHTETTEGQPDALPDDGGQTDE